MSRCKDILESWPDWPTFGKDFFKLPITSKALPCNRTFPCYRYRKNRPPSPCFCLLKRLSRCLWGCEDGWRTGMESLVTHPPQEPLLAPRLQSSISNSHLLLLIPRLYTLSPLTLTGLGETGGPRRSVLLRLLHDTCNGIHFLISGHIILMGLTGSGNWSAGVRRRVKCSPPRGRGTTVCQEMLIPARWTECTRVYSTSFQIFETMQLFETYCWQYKLF